MNEEIKRHIAERVKLIEDARKITVLVSEQKRSMTADEKTNFEKLVAGAEEHKSTINALEKQMAFEAELSLSTGRKTDFSDPGKVAKPVQNMMKALAAKMLDRKNDTIQKMLDNMPAELNADYMELLRKSILNHSDAQFAGELRRLEAEGRKDYQIDLPTQGGYILPIEVSAQILLRLLNMVYVRARATVMPLTSYAAEIPSLDVEPTSATPSGEVSEMSHDTAGTLGRRLLKPHLLPIEVIIARDLLRFSPSFEGVIIDRVSKGYERTEEQLFMTGTGNGQPLGLFTSPGATGYAGIPTDRNVVCGSATAPTYDGIIDSTMSLKRQYRQNASWMLSRDFVKLVLKLKDNMGRPLWTPGLIVGAPDMLNGRPVDESEYVPNTFTTGKAVGMFADMSYYWIAQALGFEVQPLLEKHALTNQLGFACRQWVDGMPMLSEAFSRLILG